MPARRGRPVRRPVCQALKAPSAVAVPRMARRRASSGPRSVGVGLAAWGGVAGPGRAGGSDSDGERGQHVGQEIDQEQLPGAKRGSSGESGAEHGEGDFAGVAAEEDRDGVTDAVPQGVALVHGIEDAAGVEVGEDEVGRGAGRGGAVGGQSDADVGQADCGGIVDSVAGHGDNVPGLLQRLDDADLVLGGDAGEDRGPVGRLDAFRFGQGVEVGPGQDGVVLRDAQVAGDGRGGGGMITSDHDDSHTRGGEPLDGLGRPGPGSVGDRQEAQQGHLIDQFGQLIGWVCRSGGCALGDGQDPQSAAREAPYEAVRGSASNGCAAAHTAASSRPSAASVAVTDSSLG